MPVIVFASPKGGVGKSTSALLLAHELAHEGATVSLIDADPNEVIVKWSKAGDYPDNITVHGNITEDTILDVIDEERQTKNFVIVDLEGSKNLKISRSIGRAELVIIPLRPSQIDVTMAAEAIKLVRTEGQYFGRTIPHRLLFTMTSAAIMTRDHKAAIADLGGAGVPIFETTLNERAAFRALFAYGGTVRDLPEKEVRNIEAAADNATAFFEEVVNVLKANRGKGDAA